MFVVFSKNGYHAFKFIHHIEKCSLMYLKNVHSVIDLCMVLRANAGSDGRGWAKEEELRGRGRGGVAMCSVDGGRRKRKAQASGAESGGGPCTGVVGKRFGFSFLPF